MLNLVLLSGGSGKRLWPLSNDARSKQFLKLLSGPSGDSESMVQRVYRQIQESTLDARVVIATSVSQVDSIRSQLGSEVVIVTEPERRDTFPAIALAAAYLCDKLKCSRDEPVVVMPVDPYTEIGYFETIVQMEQAVLDHAADIVLMGITPTYPSEKYGYILPMDNGGYRFIEKPDAVRAEELIRQGALWNGGVFAFRTGYLLGVLAEKGLPEDYETLYNTYGAMRKISFDYEIVEQASSIAVVPFHGVWKDMGTWNTLSEEIREDIGQVICGEGTDRTQIINELDIPLVALGVKDMVVAASPDGILVAGKNESSFMKPYVDQISRRPMYEERRWGYYKVLDYYTYGQGVHSLTKHLFVHAGKKISYQSHAYRDEIWTIVEGAGILMLDGHTRNVRRGDVAYITAGMKHALCAVTDLHMIEVQIGDELTETDIIRHDLDWQ